MKQVTECWTVIAVWEATRKFPREVSFLYKWMSDHRAPVFRTRDEARRFVRDRRAKSRAFMSAKVVRATMTIECDASQFLAKAKGGDA